MAPPLRARTTLSPMIWLAQRPDIAVTRIRLPDGQVGRWYPAQRVIMLDDRLSRAEERDTLAHEIAHILRGDPWGDPEQESNTDKLAQLIFGSHLARQTLTPTASRYRRRRNAPLA